MTASTIRTIRTVIQVLLGLAAAGVAFGPELLVRIREDVNVPAWVVTFALAVITTAGLITRVWAALEKRYPSLQSWLTADRHVSADDAGLPFWAGEGLPVDAPLEASVPQPTPPADDGVPLTGEAPLDTTTAN